MKSRKCIKSRRANTTKKKSIKSRRKINKSKASRINKSKVNSKVKPVRKKVKTSRNLLHKVLFQVSINLEL